MSWLNFVISYFIISYMPRAFFLGIQYQMVSSEFRNCDLEDHVSSVVSPYISIRHCISILFFLIQIFFFLHHWPSPPRLWSTIRLSWVWGTIRWGPRIWPDCTATDCSFAHKLVACPVGFACRTFLIGVCPEEGIGAEVVESAWTFAIRAS